MCCFSGKVEGVEGTRIFARMSAPGRQVLAYQMSFTAAEPVAMILPLPTAPGPLRFISLEEYPDFFDDVQDAFPKPAGLEMERSLSMGVDELAVEEVGDFIASFVPTRADFARLDARFRLPQLPGYDDWGFAVFQLKALKAEVHPMAFEFPTRTERLFFPCVHVHDGTLHPTAEFAHTLYAQGAVHGWWQGGVLGKSVDAVRAKGLIDADAAVFSKSLYGTLPNEDLWS